MTVLLHLVEIWAPAHRLRGQKPRPCRRRGGATPRTLELAGGTRTGNERVARGGTGGETPRLMLHPKIRSRRSIVKWKCVRPCFFASRSGLRFFFAMPPPVP